VEKLKSREHSEVGGIRLNYGNGVQEGGNKHREVLIHRAMYRIRKLRSTEIEK
jgi:hypothetical protein